MKKTVCIYFQVHQPWRLTKLNILNTNQNKDLFVGFGKYTNQTVFEKVAQKCYYPTNKLLLKLLKKYPDFSFNFSLSGTFLDQMEIFDKKLLKTFQKLVDTGRVELFNETYYHSLSWVFSKNEFVNQIKLHRTKIWKMFKRRPVVFRNTELIYDDNLANFVRILGYDTVVAEGWDKYLGKKTPNEVYNAHKKEIETHDRKIAEQYKFVSRSKPNIKLLLKNYRLSDDIAFRYSDTSWSQYPMTAAKFTDWVEGSDGSTINLFMDYESFGEHQWESTGIFDFLAKLPDELIKRGISFKTASDTVKSHKTAGSLSVPDLTSWADESRDLSAWIGNNIQDSAIAAIYEIESKVLKLTKGSKNKEEKQILLETWRRLQTSDHFYYMCTKYWNDGDVHKYFSPYDSPYLAYINFMTCFQDFVLRLEKLESLDNKK